MENYKEIEDLVVLESRIRAIMTDNCDLEADIRRGQEALEQLDKNRSSVKGLIEQYMKLID